MSHFESFIEALEFLIVALTKGLNANLNANFIENLMENLMESLVKILRRAQRKPVWILVGGTAALALIAPGSALAKSRGSKGHRHKLERVVASSKTAGAVRRTGLARTAGIAQTAGPSAQPKIDKSFRSLAGLDRSVEVRGQARTLSMMLVLKNEKDNINFIKVRKDYGAEIRSVEF